MRYIFLGGCARSGTTSLWSIIASGQNAAIGVERYVGFNNKPGEFVPELYEKERFFDIQKGETRYSSVADVKNYQGIEEKFDNSDIRGDKIPMLANLLPAIHERFENVTIVYIIRNLLDVANSFQKRANDPEDSWPERRNFAKACEEWNQSVHAARDWSDKMQFILIDYEGFFGGKANIRRIASRLGLDETVMQRKYNRAMRPESTNGTSYVLSGEERQYVAVNGDFAAYARLVSKAKLWHLDI